MRMYCSTHTCQDAVWREEDGSVCHRCVDVRCVNTHYRNLLLHWLGQLRVPRSHRCQQHQHGTQRCNDVPMQYSSVATFTRWYTTLSVLIEYTDVPNNENHSKKPKRQNTHYSTISILQLLMEKLLLNRTDHEDFFRKQVIQHCLYR